MLDTRGMMEAMLQSQMAGTAPFLPNEDDGALARILKPLAAGVASSRIGISKPGKFNLAFGDSTLPSRLALAQVLRKKKQGNAPPTPRTPTTGVNSIGM